MRRCCLRADDFTGLKIRGAIRAWRKVRAASGCLPIGLRIADGYCVYPLMSQLLIGDMSGKGQKGIGLVLEPTFPQAEGCEALRETGT